MAKLAIRSTQPEQMDDPDLDPETYRAVLADLARVNRWTLTVRPTLRYLNHAGAGLKAFSLLDVGFGQGDMLRAIAGWARRRRIDVRLVGVDLNPLSEPIAAEASQGFPAIEFRTGDYRDQHDHFDFIVSSQVAHHMSAKELRGFLQFMELHAAKGWLISDLRRSALSYAAFPPLARMLRVHRIVREDGTLSIARSFRPKEWGALMKDAGLAPDLVSIRRRLPFRLTVERIFAADAR